MATRSDFSAHRLDNSIGFSPGAQLRRVFSTPTGHRAVGARSPGYPPQNDEVMAVLADEAERNDPRMANVYVDVLGNVTDEITPTEAPLVAQRVRQIGPSRMLYGSDLSPLGGDMRRGWEIFRTRVPLTDAELRQIANNGARFTR